MPKSIYEEFKTFGVVTPQLYDPVSVLMLEFVGPEEASEDRAVPTCWSRSEASGAWDQVG